MTYTSAILGEVQHPVNILSEYLTLFSKRHKVKAQILSFLDGWMLSKSKEWVWNLYKRRTQAARKAVLSQMMGGAR